MVVRCSRNGGWWIRLKMASAGQVLIAKRKSAVHLILGFSGEKCTVPLRTGYLRVKMRLLTAKAINIQDVNVQLSGPEKTLTLVADNGRMCY